MSGIGAKASSTSLIYTVGIALENFDPANGENGSSTSTPELINTGSSTPIWTGKVLVAVNLGWSRIDSSISNGVVSSDYFNIDSKTGALVSRSTLDISGFDIKNVSSIASASGAWSINANGNLAIENLEVRGTVKVGSPERRTGITMYDEATGVPYCLTISGGATKTSSGECSSASSALAISTSTPQNIAVASSSAPVSSNPDLLAGLSAALSGSVSALTDTSASTSTASTSTPQTSTLSATTTNTAITPSADTTTPPEDTTQTAPVDTATTTTP